MGQQGDDRFPPGCWHARWIWATPGDAGRGRHTVALRATIPVDESPSEPVWARCFSNSRHVVWINGAEVAHGPARSNPRRGHYDAFDIAPHLTAGANAVAVLATSYRQPTPWFLPPPDFANDLVEGAFVFEALLGAASAQARWGSSSSWRATLVEGWTATPAKGVSGRGVEQIVADSLPAGWKTAEVDWPTAIERRAHTSGEPGNPAPPSYPFGPHGARPMAMAEGREIALTPSGSDWLADRVEVGTLVVDADGPAGSTVTVTASERVVDGKPVLDPQHDAVVRFELDGTHRTLETVDQYGFGGLSVEVSDGVHVHAVSVRDRTYPVAGSAEFRCSDPVLEHVWAAGRRSVTINSYDAYTDCPTREQRAWTGDGVVHQMVDLTTNTDWRLARAYPAMAASPRADGMLPMATSGDIEHFDFTVIPDWALHWVHAVHNLWRYCGDHHEIAELLPVVEGVLRWFDRFDDGSGMPVDVSGWVIIDWASVHTAGASSALCGLLGRGLSEFAEMSAWVGDEGRARWARQRHERLSEAFERFWDADRRLYVDSWLDGRRQPMVSQHGQAAAIVGRLAPEDRFDGLVAAMVDSDRRVWAAFRSPDSECPPNAELPLSGDYLRVGHPDPWWDVEQQIVGAQPFFRYVVHDALADAGRADLIPSVCRDWQWALDRCPTSLTETWFGGTVSHGWSSTPTRDLMTRVLGVTPYEPGFGVAQVAPCLGDLEWAEGRVPTPAGMIEVTVSEEELTVDTPIPAVVSFGGSTERVGPGRHRMVARSDTSTTAGAGALRRING